MGAVCEAGVDGLTSFYQRKAETLASILRSKHEERDLYIPKALTREFDEQSHLPLALAAWHF